MGANNHPTTQPETDDKSVRRERLKSDLAMCPCIEGVRDSMLAGIVVETTARGFEADAVSVLAEHDARIGDYTEQGEPWEVFLE
jgi:hypothetical protein